MKITFPVTFAEAEKALLFFPVFGEIRFKSSNDYFISRFVGGISFLNEAFIQTNSMNYRNKSRYSPGGIIPDK